MCVSCHCIPPGPASPSTQFSTPRSSGSPFVVPSPCADTSAANAASVWPAATTCATPTTTLARSAGWNYCGQGRSEQRAYYRGVKRHVRDVAACLLLGIVTAVAVAWCCASALSVTAQQPLGIEQPSQATRSGKRSWQYWRATALGHEQVAFTALYRPNDTPFLRRMPPSDGVPDLPYWVDMPASESLIPHSTVLYVAAGWPLRCLASRCYERDIRWHFRVPRGLSRGQVMRMGGLGHSPFWKNAIVIEDQVAGGPFTARVLPLRPIPIGMTVNSLFWGILWFLLILNARQIRRWLRASRGHCPACRYDLRGDLEQGCPECGWRREAAS